ncbi:MAG: hypothetical protein WD852_09660 [Methyloceanibacter sp.]
MAKPEPEIAKELDMAEHKPDIGKELRQIPAEPLLPIEKKLIGWSLGLGAVLLVVLVWLTGALFPA